MGEGPPGRGWLPIGVSAGATTSVKWMEFGAVRLAEPFFAQTVFRMRAMTPPARERVTDAAELLERARASPVVTPALVILHVSRCGSTLLSNALGGGERAVVLSEAPPVGALLGPATFGDHGTAARDAGRACLDAVIRVCAHHHYERDAKVVVKCNALSTLWINRLRTLWPSVPFVIVIRNPIEVIVSNVERPSGWARTREAGDGVPPVFGWDRAEAPPTSAEEYCARGVGCFLDAVLKHRDRGCRVVDFDELNLTRIAELASVAGIELPLSNPDWCRRVFGTYAKDPSGVQPFEHDGQRKRDGASATIRMLARKWAEPQYQRLRRGDEQPVG